MAAVMIQERFSLTDAECKYIVCRNLYSTTILQGSPVSLEVPSSVILDQFCNVTRPEITTLSLVIGIAAEDIVSQQRGKILVEGECTYALVENDDAVLTRIGD